jgi:hypothetical protein
VQNPDHLDAALDRPIEDEVPLEPAYPPNPEAPDPPVVPPGADTRHVGEHLLRLLDGFLESFGCLRIGLTDVKRLLKNVSTRPRLPKNPSGHPAWR